MTRRMVEQQRDMRRGTAGPHRLDIEQIAAIERDDMVEAREITGRDLPPLQPGDIEPLRRRGRDRAAIGRAADMPVAGARRIHRHHDPAPVRLGPHRRFGERRTADIAEADEQDAIHQPLTTPQAKRPPALPVGSVL
jgi:hypothetical protein